MAIAEGLLHSNTEADMVALAFSSEANDYHVILLSADGRSRPLGKPAIRQTKRQR
jgi:hypothetical protein